MLHPVKGFTRQRALQTLGNKVRHYFKNENEIGGHSARLRPCRGAAREAGVGRACASRSGWPGWYAENKVGQATQRPVASGCPLQPRGSITRAARTPLERRGSRDNVGSITRAARTCARPRWARGPGTEGAQAGQPGRDLIRRPGPPRWGGPPKPLLPPPPPPRRLLPSARRCCSRGSACAPPPPGSGLLSDLTPGTERMRSPAARPEGE